MDEGLHAERLDAVMAALRRCDARQVVDLGCGTGSLLQRLLSEAQIERVIGLDVSAGSLAEARQYLSEAGLPVDAPRMHWRHASFTQLQADLIGIDAATLIETIEHIDPGQLGQLGEAVFAGLQPACLIVTTPNVEYNRLFDMPAGVFRDPDHKFEWPRARFRQWGWKQAERYGYRVRFSGIGPEDIELGPPTQMAVFTRKT